MIRKLIRVNWTDLLLSCGVVAGAFLATHLITAGIMVYFKPNSSVMLSGLLLPIFAGIMIFLITFSNILISLPLAVRMGQTRRRALTQVLGLAGGNGLCTMVLAALLARLEPLFSPALWRFLSGMQRVSVAAGPRSLAAPDPGVDIFTAYPELQEELWVANFSHILPWWGWVLILFGAIAGGIVFGAILERFGQRGLWSTYAVFMAVFLVFPQLPWAEHWFSFAWLFPVLAILAVAALIWSVWSLLRMTIKA